MPPTEAITTRTAVTDATARAVSEITAPVRGALAATEAPVDAAQQLPSRESVLARAGDPVQAVSSASAQSPLTAAPIAPTAGGPQVPANPPLPPHLEALSVARDAPATEWGDGVGERVSWMINQKQNAALIRLDPPTLGRLEVQIRVAEDATTIMIQTQHGQTRDLIEAGVPRLREFLQEAGFQNVNVDVSQQQERQQAHPGQQPDFEIAEDRESDATETGSDWVRGNGGIARSGDNLVDTFA